MAPDLRFSDALYCIDTSDGTLRQWLNNGKVKLECGYGREWATFTLRDIANLALTHALAVDFNVQVSEAFKIAQAAIQQWRHPRAKGAGEEFCRGWKGHRLILRRDDKGEWLFSRVSISSTLAGNFLSIDVQPILQTAIDRAHAAARQRRGREKQGATTQDGATDR